MVILSLSGPVLFGTDSVTADYGLPAERNNGNSLFNSISLNKAAKPKATDENMNINSNQCTCHNGVERKITKLPITKSAIRNKSGLLNRNRKILIDKNKLKVPITRLVIQAERAAPQAW